MGYDRDRIVLGQFLDQFLDLAVEIGSSAEHGSSNRITSGRTARCGQCKPLLLAAGQAETLA